MPGWGWKWGWQGMAGGDPDYYADPSSLSGVVAWYHMDEDAGSVTEQEDAIGSNANPLTINGSMDSNDLVTGAYGNGQDFDGSDDCLSQKSYEDESGGSWGATVHGISLVDGTAFFNCSGVDLSGFAGVEGTSSAYMLVLKDSSSNPAWGFIGNQDAAQALGSDLFDSGAGTFESGTYSWVANGNNTIENDSNTLKVTYVDDAYGAQLLFKDAADLSSDLTVGKLYRLDIDAKINAGLAGLELNEAQVGNINTLFNISETEFTSHTVYFTAQHSSNMQIRIKAMSGSEIVWLDNIVLREVTHVGATGVHIVSTEGGSTRNWTSVDGSFDYNDSSYTFDVYGTDFQLTGDISVGAWVRPADGQPQGGSQAIASKGDPSGVNCETGWNLELSSDGSYLVTLSYDGSTTVTRQSTTTESDGEKGTFALVGFSFDSSEQTLNFYYDGSADNGTLTGTVPASLNTVWDPLRVGSNILDQFFDGDIDEGFICNSAISAADWAALYVGAA